MSCQCRFVNFKNTTMVGDVDTGGSYTYMEARSVRGVTSTQFCCEPKCSKKQSFLKNYMERVMNKGGI